MHRDDGDHGDPTDPPGDPESVARIICLRLLSVRARTHAELTAALAKRGVPPDAAERVLSRFAEVGLVDDTSLATTYARHQHHDRGLSGRAVAAKLRQRGVDESTVRTVVARIDPDSERAAAVYLARRKLAGLDGVAPDVRRRRLYALLGRRGYSAEVALAAADEALATPET